MKNIKEKQSEALNWKEIKNPPERPFVKHRHDPFRGHIKRAILGAGTPYVSIIIPTLGMEARPTLRNLLLSIPQQSLRPIEIILIEGENRQGRAINVAAAMAQSETLITLDDDIVIGHIHIFKNLHQVMMDHTDIGMAGVENRVLSNAPWLVRRIMKELPRRSSPAVQEIIDSDMAEHPCSAFRKSVFYAVGGENEIIPRGLDPYLRHMIREAGHRVVVIPNTWIHHIPPNSFPKLIKQFYRNGYQSAYCTKFYPQWIYELTYEHKSEPSPRVSLTRRVIRTPFRIVLNVLRGRFIALFLQMISGLGFLWGWVTIRK